MNFKNDEKAKRVKFLRALEKIANAAFLALKREDFDEEKFRFSMRRNGEFLAKIEPVFLDKPYNKKLLEFVNLVLSGGEKDVLVKRANELDKLKKSGSFKRSNARIV